jgi:hypothetical protein
VLLVKVKYRDLADSFWGERANCFCHLRGVDLEKEIMRSDDSSFDPL